MPVAYSSNHVDVPLIRDLKCGLGVPTVFSKLQKTKKGKSTRPLPSKSRRPLPEDLAAKEAQAKEVKEATQAAARAFFEHFGLGNVRIDNS